MPESRDAAPDYVLRGALLSDGESAADSVVAVTGGRIAYAGPGSSYDPAQLPGAEELPLPPGSSLLPGLVDLHCHGAAGGGFPTGDDKTCREAADFLHRQGTTTLLASLVTASADELLRASASSKSWPPRVSSRESMPKALSSPTPAAVRRIRSGSGTRIRAFSGRCWRPPAVR